MYNHRIVMILGGEVTKSIHEEISSNIQIYTSISPKHAWEIAKDLINKNEVDLFISTAAMADDLSRKTSLPVVRVDASEYDLLVAISEAENKSEYSDGKLVLLMHDSRKLDVSMFQPYLKRRIVLYNYHKDEDIDNIVENIRYEKNITIIGGPIVIKSVTAKGIEVFGLQIGKTSLNMAVKQANQILNFNQSSQESQRRVETALNLLPQGVLITDNGGIITGINNKACEMFSMQYGELEEKCIDNLISDVSFSETYIDGVQKRDKIVKINDKKFLTNHIPIVSLKLVEGGIFVFQDSSEIERLEKKFRRFESQGMPATPAGLALDDSIKKCYNSASRRQYV